MRPVSYPSRQFAVFRIAFGLFLVTHFASLLPYAGDIYGPDGMYRSGAASPFPSVLALFSTGFQVQAFVAVLALLSALLLVGIQRRVVAVLLWYGAACLANRVYFLYIPGQGLVGWMLLFLAVAPAGEALSLHPRPRSDWELDPWLWIAAWLVLGVGYFASGFDKLTSPSWQQGIALRSVLDGPMGRWDSVAEIARQAPDWLVKTATWSVLATEMSFLFLSAHRRTRPMAWLVMTTMHLGIRVTLDLHTVSDVFLVAHILLFDARWLDRSSSRSAGRRGSTDTARETAERETASGGDVVDV